MASLKQIEFSIRFFGVCLLHVSISVLSKHCIFLSYLKREQGLDSVHSSERIWFHWSGITCIPRLLWAEWLKKKTTAQCWAVIGILAVIVVFIFFSAVIVRQSLPPVLIGWLLYQAKKSVSQPSAGPRESSSLSGVGGVSGLGTRLVGVMWCKDFSYFPKPTMAW